MSFEEIEKQWSMRKRGRRKERLVLAAVLVVILTLVVFGTYYALRGGEPT